MWQVNGFDRRCFQVGRGFRIAYGLPPGHCRYSDESPEVGSLLNSCAQHLFQGSAKEAVEVAGKAVALARKEQRLLPEALRLQVKALCWEAESSLEPLAELEGQIEAEAKAFYQAGNGRGVALMRLALAEVDLQRGGLVRCGSALQLATEAMAELRPKPDYLEAQLERALALLGCGQAAQADAGEILEASRASGDRRWEAAALHVSALSKALRGTRSAYEEALRQLQHAQSLYRELQLWNCHYSVELSMARLYLESEQPREAIQIAEEALVLIQDLGDARAELRCYGLLCQALLDAEEDALPRCREALLRPYGQRWRAEALELRAAVEPDIEAARHALREALEMSRELQDVDLEARLYLRHSSLEAGENDDLALQALEQAQSLWRKGKEQGEALACSQYLSVSVLLRMFDPKESLKEASQARAFFAEEKDRYREGLALVAISSVSYARGEEEDAKESLLMAKELFREANEPRMEVLVLQTLAEMDDQALDLLQRARAVAQEAGWREEELRSLIEIAKLQREEDVRSSARTSREGLRMAKQLGMLEGQVQLLMQCVQCNLVVAQQRSSRNLLEETQRLANEAVKLTVGKGWRRRWRGLALYWQAHSMALSDPAEAKKLLEALVEFCRGTENVGLEAHARLLEAQIDLSSDKVKALETLRLAAESFKRLGDRRGAEMAEEVRQRATPAMPVARAIEAPLAALEPQDVVPAKGRRDPSSVKQLIMDLATDAVASETPLYDDSVLMDMGMDSLTSVAFRNDLQMKLGLELPASLIFEYPSVGELTKLVMSLSDL